MGWMDGIREGKGGVSLSFFLSFSCFVNDATTFLVSIDCCAGLSKQRDEVSWTEWLAGCRSSRLNREDNDDRDSVCSIVISVREFSTCTTAMRCLLFI